MGNYGANIFGSAADYKDQMQGYMQRIENRQPFKFDLNNDALYQQYRDQYTRLGKAAMEDTMGQAAGLTGGYGSTYAENAGQQAYHAYLDRLNDVVPDIYAQQRAAYDAETNELFNRWQAANSAYGTAYQHELAQNQMDYERAWNEDARAYERERDAREQAQAELNSILAAGGTPPDSLIAASGYSSDYINAMKTFYQQQGVTSSGNTKPNTTGTTKGDKYTESELKDKYAAFQNGTLSQSDLESYVAAYAKATGMTEEEVWEMIAPDESNTGNSNNNGTAPPILIPPNVEVPK